MERAPGAGSSPRGRGGLGALAGAGHAVGSEVSKFAWNEGGKGHWAVRVLAFALKAVGSH